MKHNRVYISSDIEGVAGVVSHEQVVPEGFEYQEAREWMTAEVIAACDAAIEMGVTDIVVSDSHGNGQNLLLDRLPTEVQVVRSWPRPLCMMEGIQEGDYDAAFLMGYHSGATTLRGVMAHTLHGGGISEIRLNGMVASETLISAATAGQFGVPITFVSGDDAYIEHAHELLDSIEGVTTKWALSTRSARSLLPQVACGEIRSGVITALDQSNQVAPFCIKPPIELQVSCVRRRSAELLDYLPNIKRLDAYTIQYKGDSMIEISKFLSFLLASGALVIT